MPGEDQPYETIFSQWKERLETSDHDEEEHDAALESGAELRTTRIGVLGIVRAIPAPVYALVALLLGMLLGSQFPQLSFIGEGVREAFGYLGDAVPLIIFFTLTPALITMYKTSSAGKFALYVMIGFTLTTAFGGLFALLVSLAFFPDMTLGFGATGLGAILSEVGGRTLDLATTSQPFKAIWGALLVSTVLYFAGGLKGDAPRNPLRRMFRTIADIYELIGVHGVAALGRVITVVMPIVLLLIGIFLTTTVTETLNSISDCVAGSAQFQLGDEIIQCQEISAPPYTATTAYFLAVGVIVVITTLWLLLASFALSQYTKFPLGRMMRDYTAPVYLFAWTTSSSAVTIPVNLESARKGLGIRSSIRDFIVPLGATVNLDGTMMAAVVTTIVAGKMVGYTPSVLDLLIALIPLILITVGTPGVPGGLAIVAAPILAELLPLVPGTEAVFTGVFIALGFGLNDQFRTAVNTVDNGFLALLMDKWWPEKFAPGAEPNPFMRSPDEVVEHTGKPIDESPFWSEDKVDEAGSVEKA